MRWSGKILAASIALAALNTGVTGFARHARIADDPADNPSTSAKVALGRRLFYDADLSLDGTISCATCHEQHRGFSEGNATHGGVGGAPGRRNVPGLANVAFLPVLTWADPNQRRLEAQVSVPLLGTHPVEMGMLGHEAEISRRFTADPCYRAMFAAAFPASGGAIDTDLVAKALAAFERRLVSDHTPYDAWLAGHRQALPPAARDGLRAFGAAGCSGCHAGPDLTDGAFHIIAPPQPDAIDLGLAEKSGRAEDIGAFRTPGLRNVAVTAPYLHDGSAKTIAEAIHRHADFQNMDEGQVQAIEQFLAALTDRRFLSDPRMSLPSKACGRRL